MFKDETVRKIRGDQDLLQRIINELGIIPIPETDKRSEKIRAYIKIGELEIRIETEVHRAEYSGVWISIGATRYYATYKGDEAVIFIGDETLDNALAGMKIE